MKATISLNNAVEGLLQELGERRPLRAGSLVVTVFGDILMPRNGAIATQSLVDVMKLFGIGEGVLRTALSRLSAEGMFTRTRTGRLSFYRLTESAWEEYEEAAQVIYADPPSGKWNGDWLVILDIGSNGERISDDDDLKKNLQQLGFAKAGPNVYLRPSMQDPGLRRRLDFILDDQPALVIEGQGSALPTGFKGAVEGMWDIDELARGYNQFVRRFEPLSQSLERGAEIDDRHALILRVLAIHEYRQLVLKDPHLPLEILPARWAGDLARTLCRDLYMGVYEASEHWVDSHCAGEEGTLPPSNRIMINRFGGVLA